ncbi:MAG: Lrp/AsnC ligand binding domain-containing protein [Muribaculaceae bacterium]|nr:Lrp/AsnC ligand binding domain-containing protein [Muribaculaceae bacterium]
MNHQQLDKTDLQILRKLAEDGRKPYLEIARELGVSGAAIHQRLQRLTARGVVKGTECLINLSALGYDTCAYIGILLNDPTTYERIIAKLEKIPEVVECHFTTGQYDMFIKVVARNNNHLLQIIQTHFQRLEAARTETIISFKEVFKRQAPIREPE